MMMAFSFRNSSNYNIFSRVFIHILPRLLAMKRPQYEKDRHRLVERQKGQKKLSLLPISASSLGYTQALSLFGRSQFLPLAELLTVHPPQRAAKTNARFSLFLFLSHFLLHFLSFLARCDLLKSPYFSFTTEDNYYAPEENELTELEFSLKQSSKRKR